MKCPSCCSFIPTGSKVCPKCGCRLQRSSAFLTMRSPARHGDVLEDPPLPERPVPNQTTREPRATGKWRAGERIAKRYEVIKSLGEGGMGEVYTAFDKALERKVAIKRILPLIRKNPNAMSRFLTEAKSIARLNHQNVVYIFDIIEHQEDPCIVMEYIDGPSVLQFIGQRRKVPLLETFSLIDEIACGLSAIHNEGVIHRDVKPSNVLIDRWGVPKIVDFGLAKILSTDFKQISKTEKDEGITISGTAIGTWEYASPEQMKNAKRVDGRTDIYSLGAMMYHMLTGESPRYFRENEIPPRLKPVLLKAMARKPEDRYPNMEVFRAALSEVRFLDFTKEAATFPCPFCGVILPDLARFCMACGRAISAGRQEKGI